MKIIGLEEVEKNEVHMEGAVGAWKQMPISSQDGAPVYSYRVFTVEPGGYTPYHQHPYEHMNSGLMLRLFTVFWISSL